MVGFHGGLEAESLGLSPEQYLRLRNVFDVQSCVFMSEIVPHLWDLYPDGLHSLSVLDVGARTAAGTELLRYLHHPHSFSRIKLDVTALDISREYVDYARFHFPELKYLVADILASPQEGAETQIPKKDIVICSHTLEHVPDPVAFLNGLKALAKSWVIVATPFSERELINGHLNRLDFEFFQSQAAYKLTTYRSLTWHGSMACVAIFRAH